MTNHKAEMMAATSGSVPAQVSPSLKELPGPSAVPAPPTPILASQAVKSTPSQIIHVAKDSSASSAVATAGESITLMSTQLMSQRNQTQNPSNNSTSQPSSQNAIVPTISGTTTNVVQVKEMLNTNSVLANYVKTKALKTNHNQSPSSSSQSAESMTQILLPFTPPPVPSSTSTASMSAPPKSIKAPMLQRQLMSPLKPLSNLIKDGVSGLGSLVGANPVAPSAVAK